MGPPKNLSQSSKITSIQIRHTKIEIDVEQFARDIKSGKGISGADGALSSLIKQLTEAALRAKIILI